MPVTITRADHPDPAHSPEARHASLKTRGATAIAKLFATLRSVPLSEMQRVMGQNYIPWAVECELRKEFQIVEEHDGSSVNVVLRGPRQ